MILVYSHIISPRLRYAFNMLFIQFLGAEVSYTTKIEEFISFEGPKLSYTKKNLGNELFFKSHELLFEKGISEQNVQVSSWKGLPIFFEHSSPSVLPFDLFAASFFLLSRYEEYLPHIKDRFHRFPAEKSLAFQYGFLKTPIVEYWLKELLVLICEKFPDFHFKKRAFQFINTIDIDNAFCYREKGFFRTIGATLRSISNLDFKDFKVRLQVLMGRRKDPYDTYDYLLSMQKKYGFESIYFFLVGDYGLNDKNINYTNKNFQILIKSMADYAKVGIHPSWASNSDSKKLANEVKRLGDILNREVIYSRQHFLRLDLPVTYRRLIDLGILEDYSMGYASQVGFRAGTSLPFFFYDLDMEIQTQLLVHPFAVMDGTLNEYLQLTTDEAQYLVKEIMDSVKEVNGRFVSLWHNETLTENRHWDTWKKVYEYTLEEANT
tara:strand:+ start:1258 stop:2562 length:1305 start_codon:yes stop_codon:yes gene_type:complete